MKSFLLNNKFVLTAFFLGILFIWAGDSYSIGKDDFLNIVKSVCFVFGITLTFLGVLTVNLPPYKRKVTHKSKAEKR